MLDDLITPSPGQVDLTLLSQIFKAKYHRHLFAENYPLISKTSGFSLGVYEGLKSSINFIVLFFLLL